MSRYTLSSLTLRALIPMAVFLTLTPSIIGQVKLAWNIKEGDRFFVEEATSVRQTIKIMGMENRQDLDQTRLTRFTLLKKNKDGSQVFEQTILKVKVKVSGEGPDVNSKVLQQFEGAGFQITLDAGGKVTKVAGYENLVKKIARDNKASARLVRAVLTEDSLKVPVQNLLGFLPAKDIAKGDSWQHQATLPLGPLGTLALVNTYTLERIEEGSQVARLSLTGRASYQPPPEDAGLSLKITGGNIRLAKSAGNLDFDLSKGRLARLESKQSLQGNLRVTIREANLDMEFQQDQTTNLRVLEQIPPKK